jgi:hypothetical protein
VAATATGGAVVSIERAAGWSRQLRVTPLSPAAYVLIKMLTSLVRDFRGRCRLVPAPRHCQSVTQPRSHALVPQPHKAVEYLAG